jgi:hypothetical protein
MNAADNRRPAVTPVTPAHVEAMERGAAAALGRRSPAYFIEVGLDGFGIATTGALSLAALWFWNAPPAPILLWLLASAWIGICGEWLKYALLGTLVQREMAVIADDMQVWFVAEALRSNDANLRGRVMTSYTPLRAMAFDLVAGTAATAAMVAAVSTAGVEWTQWLDLDPGLRLTIAAVLGLQVGNLLWTTASHRLGSRHVQADFSGGVRGAALVVLAVLVLYFGAGDGDLRRGLSVANGLLLLFAMFHAAGTIVQWRECRWLRDYLRSRRQAMAAAVASEG